MYSNLYKYKYQNIDLFGCVFPKYESLDFMKHLRQIHRHKNDTAHNKLSHKTQALKTQIYVSARCHRHSHLTLNHFL